MSTSPPLRFNQKFSGNWCETKQQIAALQCVPAPRRLRQRPPTRRRRPVVKANEKAVGDVTALAGNNQKAITSNTNNVASLQSEETKVCSQRRRRARRG